MAFHQFTVLLTVPPGMQVPLDDNPKPIAIQPASPFLWHVGRYGIGDLNMAQDLSMTIAGVRFPTCFMNAAGALCVTEEELRCLGRSNARRDRHEIDDDRTAPGQFRAALLSLSRRFDQFDGIAELRVRRVCEADSDVEGIRQIDGRHG